MLNNIQEMVRIFVAAIVLTILLMIVNNDVSYVLQQFAIKIYTIIPFTFLGIIVANLSSMLIIYILGIRYENAPSFFVAVNGSMLGVFVGRYLDALDKLFDLLFPHALFETVGILLFCGITKSLFHAHKNKNYKQIQLYNYLLIFICLPIFFISLLLEVV